jgi:MFS family permease
MQSFSRDPEVDRSLRHSLKDAGAFAVMAGFGETYVSAFALFLRASTVQIGWLASIPPLLASIAQLLSAWLGRNPGRRQTIILAGSALQGVAWIPLLILPLVFTEWSLPLLIVCALICQSGAHLAAPQWSSLMGDLVPTRRRGRFFGVRTRLMTALTFFSLLAGGIILDVASRLEQTVIGFVLLFGIASLARFVSVYHLSKMSDPPVSHAVNLDLRFTQGWMHRLSNSNAVRFSAFFALVQFAVAVSSPFFTVFMLRDLHFTYLEFTINTAMAILVQFLTMAQWGRIGDVFGNRRILAVAGVVICILPSLWLVSQNFWYLLAIQAVSGFAWAGFSLAASNFVYDLIGPQHRATYLSVHNVLAGIGVFCGASLGGYLGSVIPVEIELFGTVYSWLSPLCGLFVVSSLLRALVMLILLPKLREVRTVRPISYGQLVFRVIRVNALAGVVFDIVGTRRRRDDH